MIALTCCTFALGKKPLYSSKGVMVSMTAEECPDWAFHSEFQDDYDYDISSDVCLTCEQKRFKNKRRNLLCPKEMELDQEVKDLIQEEDKELV